VAGGEIEDSVAVRADVEADVSVGVGKGENVAGSCSTVWVILGVVKLGMGDQGKS